MMNAGVLLWTSRTAEARWDIPVMTEDRSVDGGGLTLHALHGFLDGYGGQGRVLAITGALGQVRMRDDVRMRDG